MPYPYPHYQITVMGDGWTQTETWQFGVRARIEALSGPADQQALANALATPTQTFLSSSAVALCQHIRLTAIKVAAVDVDGHYTYPSAPGIYTYPAPVVGTSSSNVVPQATLAVTLLTAVARGRGSKGRFYLPPSGLVVQADGRITAANADAVETAARTWLLAVNATAQVSNVVVMSKLGAGTTNDVTAVGVGRVTDTFRSRRRSLAEGRTPLAL
jgi:hypothetical protein